MALSTIERSIEIFKDDGLFTLLNSVKRRFQNELRSLKGYYSLTIAEFEVTFSAPSATMAARNRARFNREQPELRDFLSEIEPDDVVYDVGANTGLYSLFAANRCPAGSVIAFEPYPPNVELLKRDIDRNGLENVEVRDVVLSDKEDTVAFDQPEDPDVGYGSSAIEANASGDTIEKSATTGDKLVEAGEIPAPNVVKIDVEGAEPLVIDGLESALSASSCRAVYCEVHLPGVDKRPSVADFGSTLDGIQDSLEDLGFSIETLDTRASNEIFIKATR